MEVINVIEGKKLIDEKLGEKDFELLDVRSPTEHKLAHIKGSRLIPLEEIQNYLNELDKSKTYLIYCRTGGRSGMAAQMFETAGLKAINMMGGITDWVEEDYSIEK